MADEGSQAAELSGVCRLQLSPRSWVDQFPAPEHLISAGTAELEALWVLHPAERGSIKMFGKVLPVRRWHQSYGQAYSFSGQTLGGGPIPPQLQPFLLWANSLPGYGSRFNGVLLNWYENGEDYMGPHSDDQAQLVPGEAVMSISLGATRRFRIRHRPVKGGGGGGVKADLEMPHGTVLVMGGAMQKEFKHEVPEIRGEKGASCGRRINITLRAFKETRGGGGSNIARAAGTEAAGDTKGGGQCSAGGGTAGEAAGGEAGGSGTKRGGGSAAVPPAKRRRGSS